MRGEAGFHGKSHTWQSGSKNGKLDPCGPAAQPPKCPECSNKRFWKDGIRYSRHGEVQRYLCRECGYRFSETSRGGFSDGFRHSEHAQRIHRLPLKRMGNITLERQICVTQQKGAKNLARVQSRIEKAAGATKPDQATIKGKLVEFAFWQKKQGYPEVTSSKRMYMIKRLVDLGANLWDPEDIKGVIAKQPWQNGYKRCMKYAYQAFLKMEGLTWDPPKYGKTESYPFIPTEKELDQLIAASGKTLGTFLQGLKETGADPGELAKLRWIDINKESRTINIRPVKRHNPRILPVSQEFMARLERLPKRGEHIFNKTSVHSNFYHQRRRIAHKLGNPRILKISFTTFRHWKGTMEYHKTKDPYHVKKILGHKHLTSTEIYINLEQALFKTTNDEFNVKVAKAPNEIEALLEVGFEYICEKDGLLFFRKRK